MLPTRFEIASQLNMGIKLLEPSLGAKVRLE